MCLLMPPVRGDLVGAHLGGPLNRPPFEDEGAAADWIEQTSREDLARWKDNREDLNDAHQQFHRLAHRLGFDATTTSRYLRYGRPGDTRSEPQI
jgi:hypothetical protein